MFSHVFSHLHHQPALGPTANSCPGPAAPSINSQEILKNRMKIWKNETVLQQNLTPNSFHSILGMEDALGLGFETAYAAKENTGVRRTSTNCNEVTCVSISLFLTIAQFQQLLFLLKSLTYPNYPYL